MQRYATPEELGAEHRLPGERRIELHDRLHPRRGRGLYTVLMRSIARVLERLLLSRYRAEREALYQVASHGEADDHHGEHDNRAYGRKLPQFRPVWVLSWAAATGRVWLSGPAKVAAKA